MKTSRAENSLIEKCKNVHHEVIKTPRILCHSAKVWVIMAPAFAMGHILTTQSLLVVFTSTCSDRITQCEERHDSGTLCLFLYNFYYLPVVVSQEKFCRNVRVYSFQARFSFIKKIIQNRKKRVQWKLAFETEKENSEYIDVHRILLFYFECLTCLGSETE